MYTLVFKPFVSGEPDEDFPVVQVRLSTSPLELSFKTIVSDKFLREDKELPGSVRDKAFHLRDTLSTIIPVATWEVERDAAFRLNIIYGDVDLLKKSAGAGG